MAQTTAQRFQRHFGEFRRKAQREPVEITRHGQRVLVLMSAKRYDWLVAVSKRSHATEDLPETIVEAVRKSRMSKRPLPLSKLKCHTKLVRR
ncbi:MAG TPA: type II toxin-antitoxin system prevent-host-death family antitoxin [Rhizomicrobium sp.]|nr:type II toxin-antitoxin system prevent-host-death family antitoxin [Rhizomicrobium sp.]